MRRTILRRDLIGRGERVIVACSGGPDSVAMTHGLSRLAEPLGLHLTVATVDHGLRDDADRDVALVADLAARLALPFRALKVSVEAKSSIQGAAREARYTALSELARGLGAGRIAVGHTRDDQAETVLERLLRGASIRGLSGIAPSRDDGVVRPLIDVRRTDVAAHVAHHGLDFVVDPSNEDPRFKRSRIRAELMPSLVVEDPAIVDHLASLADDARATRDLVAAAGGALLSQASRGEGLDRQVLASGGESARREALRRFLAGALGREPSRSHLVAVDDLVLGAVGTKAEVRLSRDRVVHVEGPLLVMTDRVC